MMMMMICQGTLVLCGVSFWVSVKVILADILYDLAALPALQVTDYTQQ